MIVALTALFAACGFGFPCGQEAKDGAAFECAYARGYCFDLDGRRLLFVTNDNELVVWETGAARPVAIPLERSEDKNKFKRIPTGVAPAGDGRHALVLFADGRIQIWDFNARRKVKDLANDCKSLRHAKLSADGKRVACLGKDFKSHGALLIWRTDDWSVAGVWKSEDPIQDFCFAADAREIRMAVGYPIDLKHKGFTGIVARDVETGKEVGRLEYGDGFPFRIASSPDGRWMAVGGGDAAPRGNNARSLGGHFRVFDWEARKMVEEPFQLPTNYVGAVAFRPDGKVAYAAWSESDANPRGVKTGIKAFAAPDWGILETISFEPGKLDGSVQEIAASPDGETLLVSYAGRADVVKPRTGEIAAKVRLRLAAPQGRPGEDK